MSDFFEFGRHRLRSKRRRRYPIGRASCSVVGPKRSDGNSIQRFSGARIGARRRTHDRFPRRGSALGSSFPMDRRQPTFNSTSEMIPTRRPPVPP
jgi:hypothetical protein